MVCLQKDRFPAEHGTGRWIDAEGVVVEGVSRGCAHLFELHDNLGVCLAELVRGLGLAAIRATLLGLIIHAAKLSQQALLAVQRSRHL